MIHADGQNLDVERTGQSIVFSVDGIGVLTVDATSVDLIDLILGRNAWAPDSQAAEQNALGLLGGKVTVTDRPRGPFGWTDFELDDSTDEIPDKHVLFIWEGDAMNELAVIVHRASERFPIDGELANEKRANAEYIVQALTAFAAAQNT